MHRTFTTIATVVLGLLIAGCGTSEDAGAAGAVRFIVIGDTGTGCDEGAQCAVAEVMEQVCAHRDCDFAIVTGDNIYEDGVSGVDDPQFLTKFEEPYANLDMPFYMVLGNHDVSFLIGGDGGNQTRGDFQVEYHYASDNQKWRMPFRYYTKRFPADAEEPLLELFALDSAAMVRFLEDPDRDWTGAGFDAYVMDQRLFMLDALEQSNARWKIAAAHHPYISNGGEHGNAGAYQSDKVTGSPDACVFELLGEVLSLDELDLWSGVVGSLIPVLASTTCRGKQYQEFLEDTICDRVDIFFTGHDHDLQWLEPVASCGKTHHIVSGAGAKTRAINPDRNEAFFNMGNVFGFMWVEIVGDTMTGEFYIAEPDGTPRDVDDQGRPLPEFRKTIERPL